MYVRVNKCLKLCQHQAKFLFCALLTWPRMAVSWRSALDQQNELLKGVFALESVLTQGLACRLGRRFAICWEHSAASVLLVASDGIARHTDL